MLAYDVRERDTSFPHDAGNVERLLFAQTAAGYLVNCNYYDKLIELYESALPQLIETRRHWDYANDIVWRSLQQTDKWFYFTNRIGKQRASYSDNSGKFADYGF
jgi:hypothetical protein